MIHHVSIPAKNPEHVARVLGELLGGYVGRFVGPIPGAWVAYADDAFGTGFEIYPEATSLTPSKGSMADFALEADTTRPHPFHILLSVKVDRATIEKIGAREGWKCAHDWRGPPGMKLFELYELWIENRTLIEVATEDMVAAYAKIANGPAQRELLTRLGR